MPVSRFCIALAIASLTSIVAAQANPTGQSSAAQSSAGSNQAHFKGKTIITKNKSGNDEACNIIGYQTVIGAPESSVTPFVICPSDVDKALNEPLVESHSEGAPAQAQPKQEVHATVGEDSPYLNCERASDNSVSGIDSYYYGLLAYLVGAMRSTFSCTDLRFRQLENRLGTMRPNRQLRTHNRPL